VFVSIDCRYVRERPSGIGAYTTALVDRLPPLAPRDTFHLWADRRATLPLSECDNATHEVVRWQANQLPTLLWPARLGDVSKSDVFHAPYNILGRGLKCPTVVTIHDLMWALAPGLCDHRWWTRWYQTPFYWAGITQALRRATRLIAISQTTADSILELLPSALRRVRVIRHGIAPRFRPPADREAAQTRADALTGTTEPYFLVVGQNAPYKNHRAVLEAFAAAGELSAKLVVVERLAGSPHLKRLTRQLGVHDRVVWLDQCGDDELLALLQCASALVQYSHWEGFGMPVLEAMACGTPVVISDTPALVELTGHAGVKVATDKPSELSGALKTLLNNSGWRADLSALGVEQARAFDWDRCAQQHLEVYREAAEQGGSSAPGESCAPLAR